VDPMFYVVLAAIAALVVAFIVSYNRFVAQRASIQASWAGIDVELQRRHDLVPNLVETVERYATHEQSLLQAVTEARGRAIAATSDEVSTRDQARAEDGLTDRLTSLLAIAEAFPDLKADARFRDLQRQLVETEDRISAARRLYNIDVAAYERRRGSVPSNLVASAGNFGPESPFEIQDASAVHAKQVSF
jgi:LemA protein